MVLMIFKVLDIVQWIWTKTKLKRLFCIKWVLLCLLQRVISWKLNTFVLTARCISRLLKIFHFLVRLLKLLRKCPNGWFTTGAAGDVIEKTGEFVNIPIAQEVHLEKVYNVDGTVDFGVKDSEDTSKSLHRLKTLLYSSQVDNREGGKTIITADTIHFSNKISNALELAVEANKIITPVPVNYKNAYPSGWVE